MEALRVLSESTVAELIRGSAVIYPIVNATHIAGFAILLGSIITLDLRLMGLFRAHPIAQLGPPLIRMAMAGLAVAAVTGFLLFITRPMTYLENPAFLVKLGLVALALVNAAVLHWSAGWRTSAGTDQVGGAVRASAFVSMAAWLSVVLAGRWIGFLQ